MKSTKFLFIIITAVVVASFSVVRSQSVTIKQIWEGRNYASFTSMADYEGYLYCAFREANSHADISGQDKGVIRIIKSRKGKKWELFTTYSLPGQDLRDPKLAVSPDGRLMLLTEAVVYNNGETLSRQTHVGFINKEGECSKLQPIIIDPKMTYNWLWDFCWGEKDGYGFTYIPSFSLLQTEDGVNYKVKYHKAFEDKATETSIAVSSDHKLYAFIRNENSSHFGVSTENTCDIWDWYPMEKLGCPKLFFDGQDLYLVAKRYSPSPKTVLYEVDVKDYSFNEIASLPSARDFSYPGIVKRGRFFYVSYYLGDGVKSSIYLAIIKCNKK